VPDTSATTRKRRQLARERQMIEELPPEQWPERICRRVLSSNRYADERQQAAWRRLGQLRGWEVGK